MFLSREKKRKEKKRKEKMVDNIHDHQNKVLIREFKEATDFEAVEKLEKNCEIGYKKGISIFMSGDPLCRIRLYPVHVMLVGKVYPNIYYT